MVDKHLKLASGLALKVLLLLLRTQIPLSAEEIATRLGQSQGDVRDALAYWEQAGLQPAGSAASEGQLAPTPVPLASSQTATPAEPSQEGRSQEERQKVIRVGSKKS